MRIALALGVGLGLASTGCIALSARVHVDAVTDFERHGIQAGINVGMGYADKKYAVVASAGVDTGTAPALGLHDTLDYVRLPDDEVGWRVGFGGTGALIGGPSLVGARAATLFPLRERSSSYQSEKAGGQSSYSLYALSIETALGAAVRERVESTGEDPAVRVGASAGVGLELYYLSRMWL
jgi:hypothetical protein